MRSTVETRQAVSALFENPPVLVEVRFSGCATLPDWYLFDDESELHAVLASLATGVELHVSSVWDLKNPRGAVVLRK